MIAAWMPLLLAAVLAGAGVYGVLARRHAVLVLIGVELLLAAAALLLITGGQLLAIDPLAGGSVLTLFLITIAAAEIVVALAVIWALARRRGHVDLAASTLEDDA